MPAHRAYGAVVVHDVPLQASMNTADGDDADDRDARSATRRAHAASRRSSARPSTMSTRRADERDARARSRTSRSRGVRDRVDGERSLRALRPRACVDRARSARSPGGFGLAVVGLAARGCAIARFDRRLDPVEHRLRVEAEEQLTAPSSGTTTTTSRSVTSRILAFSPVGLAGERALERPEQVDRGEDHAGRRDDRVPAVREERAEQREELADEPGEARAARSTRTSRRGTGRRASAPTFQMPRNSAISQVWRRS